MSLVGSQSESATPAGAVTSRRPTLERQSSIGRLLAISDGGTSSKSPLLNSIDQMISTSFSSERSSPDRSLGLPKTLHQSYESQDSIQSSADLTVGAAAPAKPGRKKKTPQKPGKHICQYCGRPCAKPSVLEKHIRMHTGERPFPCNVCDLSFKTKSNLYKHRKSFTHIQRRQEKGFSVESNFGESFGSSRDESMDLTEGEGSIAADDDNQHFFHSRPSSLGSSADGQHFKSLEKTPSVGSSQISAQPLRPPLLATGSVTQSQTSAQVIYLETLRQLEKVYDAVDEYVESANLIVLRFAHWLLDKSCIVSIQLQSQSAKSGVSADSCSMSAVPSGESHSQSMEMDPGSNVQTRIDKLIRDNNEIVSETTPGISRRRLSRQDSVSSPATQMFSSSETSSIPPSTFPSSYTNDPQSISFDVQSGSLSDFPNREELFKRLSQIISAKSMIDRSIKLLSHKQYIEVRLRLVIPELPARKRWGHAVSSGDIVLTASNMKVIGNSYICAQCKTSFSRRHILEIHLSFYCHGDHYAEKQKLKLLKAGSEETSSTYTVTEESSQHHKYSRSKSDLPHSDRVLLPHQSSSTESVIADGVNTKEYLKKHLLKHRSQGSVSSGSLSNSSGVELRPPSLDYSINSQSLESASVTEANSMLSKATVTVAAQLLDAVPTGQQAANPLVSPHVASMPSHLTNHPSTIPLPAVNVSPDTVESVTVRNTGTESSATTIVEGERSQNISSTNTQQRTINNNVIVVSSANSSLVSLVPQPSYGVPSSTSVTPLIATTTQINRQTVSTSPTHMSSAPSQGVTFQLMNVEGNPGVSRANVFAAVAPPVHMLSLQAAPPIQVLPVPLPVQFVDPTITIPTVTLGIPSNPTIVKTSSFSSSRPAVAALAPSTASSTHINEQLKTARLLPAPPSSLTGLTTTSRMPAVYPVPPSAIAPTSVSIPSSKSPAAVGKMLDMTLISTQSLPHLVPSTYKISPVVTQTITPLPVIQAGKLLPPLQTVAQSLPVQAIMQSSATPVVTCPLSSYNPSEQQRLSILRRRFSQTRSQSSVSFDESANKSHELTETVKITLPATINNNATANSSESPSELLTRIVSHNSTEYNPITYHVLLSLNLPDKREMSIGGVSNIKPNSADVQVSYCALDSRIPSASVLNASASVFSVYKPEKSAAPSSRWVDMSLPYHHYKRIRHKSTAYTNSSMDNRSIFTHSSYWQYKNKMRVMQSMSPFPVGSLFQATNKPAPTASANQCESNVSSMVSSALHSNTAFSSSASSVILSQVPTSKPEIKESYAPSFATADIHKNRKKVLLRSQSTPNAGAPDNQSKLIAGGFKSDEDYVYIRGRGKGKYVCQQCGIRCRKPSMLKKHIRTHTDLRPYSCKHCKFSFKTKGNLTKHMRSKAHHRRCLELNIVPVPSTVDESQVDQEILATQQKLSRESKIKGVKVTVEEGDNEGSDCSEDEDDNTSDEESSVDGALQIDEDNVHSDDLSSMCPDTQSLSLPPMNNAALRRVHSMPAHHMANSFDSSSIADIIPVDNDVDVVSAKEVKVSDGEPPPKKKKRNPLNLSIPAISKIEDDIARSLLDLSQTPVHANITPNIVQPNLVTVGETLPSTPPVMVASPAVTAAPISGVKRVSVVRSTRQGLYQSQGSSISFDDNNEPMDLRVQAKTAELKYICKLCRAICNCQESLELHMKLHDGPVIEIDNKLTRRMSTNSYGSFDQDSKQSSNKVQTPQTPNPLRRQHAISIFDSDAEEDGVDHHTKVEPGEKLNDSVARRKCPYCAKIFVNESYLPLHVKSHHLITQEYVCTYKECGDKFTNKQDLTYHLGTHALDDNDKYQPISIPKCGICEKTFKSISSLKQHIHHHAEARPHVCEYCDAGFTTAQSLKHHLKTHTQERPYVCGECGATFARSDHLTQHNKTHRKHASSTDSLNRAYEPPTILSPTGNTSIPSIHHPSLR